MKTEPAPANDSNDEFYVGYLPVPRGMRRFVVALVSLIFIGMIGGAALLATQQSSSGGGHWDFGIVREFEGRVVADPYPMLIGPHPDGASAGIVTYIVVSEGKHGSRDRLGEYDGDYVQLKASLLDRNGRYLLELSNADDAVSRIDPPAAIAGTPKPRRIGDGLHTLEGEIIDPKCYIGAMKPGGGRTHRACATLCIRGGIPPMFVTRDAELNETYYLLTDARGHATLEDIVPYIGEPVRVTGKLYRLGDLNILRVREDGVLRLD